jgi:hypothetical protein
MPSEELLRAKQAVIESRRTELANDVNSRLEDLNSLHREFANAANREDKNYWAEVIMGAEQELQTQALELERYSPQQELSAAKQEWIARRQDLVNPQTVQAAGNWHDYIVNRMGVADDSPNYFELMQTVLEPQGYEPLPTPDDVCRMTNVSPKEYNRQAMLIHAERQMGKRRD